MNESNTKLFLVEEHHEAFLVWNYGVINGFIPAKDNILLHIDEHSDSDVPRFNYSINELNGDLSKLYDFTYNELTISSFIIPSFYKGIFNTLYNISQIHSENKKKKEVKQIFVRSRNGEGKILVAGKETDEIKKTNDPYRASVSINNQTLEDDFPKDLPVVLDIDLDFFSCDENPNQFRGDKLEITKEEYDKIKNNRYHHTRISPNGGSMLKVKEINGSYYLTYFDFPYIVPSKFKVPHDEILKRINKLKQFLIENRVTPKLIDVCRSKYSAYTPPDQLEFIQSEVIKILKQLYNFEIIDINELLKSHQLT